MEALWFFGENHQLFNRKDVKIPSIENSTDVKVKVSYSGFCGSDFHFMNNEMGKFSLKSDGIILGHEFSGIVEELGEEAAKALKLGDKVVVNPAKCCGSCDYAHTGEPHFCENNVVTGVGENGGFAEYCVVSMDKVYKLPTSLSQLQGALAEPYSCVLRGWKRLEPFPSKDCKVLIQGAGIIGILFCTVLHHYKFTNVTVCETNEERRKLCRDMQLGYEISTPQEINEKLEAQDIDKCGYKIIIDCTGNPVAVERGIQIACRGAKICVFGCCPAGKKISVDPFQVYWKELMIVGAFTNPFCFEESLKLLDKLANEGYLNHEKLGIKLFSLKDYKQAIESLKSGTATKAIFKLD